jgi:mono/diheme cytochrome c family protein
VSTRIVVPAIVLGGSVFAACATTGSVPDRQQTLALPPGEGRAILERECLRCHELDALALFRDFYGREQWRALVLTMRENGARVDDQQVAVLADYLATYFGTGVSQ